MEQAHHIMSLLGALVAVLGGAALGDVGLVDHTFAADSVTYLDGEWQVSGTPLLLHTTFENQWETLEHGEFESEYLLVIVLNKYHK